MSGWDQRSDLEEWGELPRRPRDPRHQRRIMRAMYLIAALFAFFSAIVRTDVVALAIGVFLLVMWGVTRP